MTFCKAEWAYSTLKASVTEASHMPTAIETTELQILNTSL